MAYTIAEQGTSKPRVIGEGSKILSWSRAVIDKIKNAILIGVKLFVNHNDDNSTDGRIAVGEVVKTFQKEINGKLRAIAIACMETVDALKYDVCSIEAEIFENDGIVSDIKKVTGIAVSNSKISTPAFSNAKQMAMIQCFDNDLDDQKNINVGSVKKMITLDELRGVPKELITATVKERNLFPHHLFTIEDLMKDREFSPIVNKKTELETEIEKLKGELTIKDQKLNAYLRKDAESGAKGMLDKLIPKGTTETEKIFLQEMFDPQSLQEINEAELTKYIETGKTKFQTLAKKGFLKDTEFKADFDDKADTSGEGEEDKALNEAFE